MQLKKLIKNLAFEKKNILIRGLSANSKFVKKGFIFFAIKGFKVDGEKFINEAIKKGASVIVCSKRSNYNNKKILVIKTSNVRKLLSKVASKFYLPKPKNIIAVTGTNGKTSVADLFYQILNLNKIPVACIGTLGIKSKGSKIKSNLTSPDIISLHKNLQKFKKRKINNVIIEASSHGLDQKRIDNLNLKAGIFTNFSQDHLDYHKTMKSYLSAKLHLFKDIIKKNKIIICDKTIKEFKILKLIAKKRQLRLIDISKIQKKLLGQKYLKLNEFELKNLSMSIIAAKLCGVDEKKIFKSLDKIKNVSGRLELIKVFPNKVRVFIDFAHTPDALKKTLRALKENYGNDISLVFGCGGNRDQAKRPIMAEIAKSYCKKIYVTDDNPRNEKPEKIRNEILKNIKSRDTYNIGSRVKAISFAIKNADPNDIILVSGKGHETEQIYKNKIINLSDKQTIKKLKLNIKRISNLDQNLIQNRKIFREIKRGAHIGNFHGLSIDTRVIKKNNLFITIKGKKNDGTKFIPIALKKGAKYIICSKNINKFRNKIIKVKDEIKFLNKFAQKKRENSNAKIIAITGSAGKTSLKNLTKDLLQNFGETQSSPKSFNNHFGVPLSLSQLRTNDKYGIFEVGMSKKGEINKLSKLIKPHIGVITNIAEAHIENFKNLKGIADAKAELISNIKKNGTLILNRDDKFFNYFRNKAKSKSLKIISFGKSRRADVHVISLKKRKKDNILYLKIFNQIVKLQFKNINIYNVLSSMALIKELNLNLEKASNFYKKFEPSYGRGKIHNIKRYKKKFKLIDESYNANPLSVNNAIKTFSSIKKNNFKKYLLLGDMLELGKKSEILHKNLSKVINSSDIDKVFVKGSKTLNTYRNINKTKRGNIIQEDEDVDFILNNFIANNDYLMIKGSNATGLNNISKKMIKGS